MKMPRQSLSEAEQTLWLILIVLLALIISTGYLLWEKVQAYVN